MNDLTSAMKSGTYSDALWKTLTGKTIVQLWNLYDPGRHPGVLVPARPACSGRSPARSVHGSRNVVSPS